MAFKFSDLQPAEAALLRDMIAEWARLNHENIGLSFEDACVACEHLFERGMLQFHQFGDDDNARYRLVPVFDPAKQERIGQMSH